jgi:hypothetical protein
MLLAKSCGARRYLNTSGLDPLQQFAGGHGLTALCQF